VVADRNLFTCSKDTQERMKELIREHNLNRVVVASCTPRTHEPLFRETLREAGLNKYLFEMANIRDQCSWVHQGVPEAATRKAKDLIRIALAKSRLLEPLYPKFLRISQKALIIGGGLSGMTAALALAEQGFETHLVEKEAELGGIFRRVRYLLNGDDPQKKLGELIERVKQHKSIHLHTNTVVSNTEGSVGNFTSVLSTNGREERIDHGVTIVATGAKELRPSEYLYGEDERVITQLELEEKLANSGFQIPNSIVMIQCVGSREPDRPYCSRVCCQQAIKSALKIKEINPKTEVYILYRDIRSYGFSEVYYQKAREKGVMFIRYDEDKKPDVSKDGNRLKVKVRETIINAELLIKPDLLVLSPAIIPQDTNKLLSQILKVSLASNDFFLEAHMKLRPVDFATDGVYLCGLAHGPKTVDEAILQSKAAASRAATILSKGELELEAILSFVVDANCDGCAYCVDTCPFKAITLIEYMYDGTTKKVVDVNEAKCKGCGGCMATCPKEGIYVRHFKPEMLSAMVDAALEPIS